MARRRAPPSATGIGATNADHCPAPDAATIKRGMSLLRERIFAASAQSLLDPLGFQQMSMLRVALAFSAMLLTQHVQDTLFVLLAGYAIYAVIVHGLIVHRHCRQYFRIWHWLDAAWGVAVVAASGGDDNLFYLFFIYPITTAALHRSVREGVAVTVAMAAAWVLAVMAGADDDFETAQGLQVSLRVAALLLIGTAIAFWAGFEAMQRRRLQLLGELNQLPNPRFGPDRLMARALEQLRDFYRADRCIAVFSTEAVPHIHSAGTMMEDAEPSEALAELAGRLLALPERCSVLANNRVSWGLFPRRQVHVGGCADDDAAVARVCCNDLDAFLGSGSWISVPLEFSGSACGRLYVASGKYCFNDIDVWLLLQATGKFMPLVESVELLDHLATNAAEKEREKISLDLHDSAIQPYLGLKLGLEALRRKVPASHALVGDIDELCRMTVDSIAELRGYVGGLGGLGARSHRHSVALMEGIQMQAERFRGFYGIEATINMNPDLHLNERLTMEVVQMIGESLSNIGRHTASRQVTINVASDNDRLVTQIINHGTERGTESGTGSDTPWQMFTPRSLTRRAQHLGGSVEVARQACGGTAVLVSIPL